MTEDMAGIPYEEGSQWYDGEAGPLVRPYAMTGGRTQPGPTGVRFDLIALVTLDVGAPGVGDDTALGPEHRALIDLCRSETQSVAELGCVTVSRPVPPAQLPDERILREVIEGLRAL
jgi:hypothetical protein